MTKFRNCLFAIGDFFKMDETLNLSLFDKDRILNTKYPYIPANATGIVSGMFDKFIKVEIPGIGEYLFGDEEKDKFSKVNQADYFVKDTAIVEVDD